MTRLFMMASVLAGVLTGPVAAQTQLSPSPSNDALRHWTGTYLSSEGSRVTIRREAEALLGVGDGSGGAPSETFRLLPDSGRLTGSWQAGSRTGTLTAQQAQLEDRIEAEITEAGHTSSYRLCRASPRRGLVHSSRGLWAELAQTSVRRESNGTSTLFVQLQLSNSGDRKNIGVPFFSARLPQHANSRPATGYYNAETDSDDAPARSIYACGATSVDLRFRNVTRAVTKLVVRDGLGDTVEFDVSAATARIADNPPPPAQPEPPHTPAEPTPTSPPGPGAPTPPQPIPAPSAFQPLNRVDVRVDRVIVARGYPTHQVHAFVTVKNTSAVPQYFTSGFLKVVLADADGVSWERSQPYRASGEPAELFGSTPVIQPGGELRVRFVFLPEADAQLTSVTLSEGGKQAQFPVSGL